MNRFYLIFSIFFIHLTGLAQISIQTVPGFYTNPCLFENDSASLRISVTSIPDMPGDLIEYDVFDSLDNIIHEGRAKLAHSF